MGRPQRRLLGARPNVRAANQTRRTRSKDANHSSMDTLDDEVQKSQPHQQRVRGRTSRIGKYDRLSRRFGDLVRGGLGETASDREVRPRTQVPETKRRPNNSPRTARIEISRPKLRASHVPADVGREIVKSWRRISAGFCRQRQTRRGPNREARGEHECRRIEVLRRTPHPKRPPRGRSWLFSTPILTPPKRFRLSRRNWVHRLNERLLRIAPVISRGARKPPSSWRM